MARVLLPYGVIVAEYLLVASAVGGGVLMKRPVPPAHSCSYSCRSGGPIVWGAMVLSVGLLVGTVVLTVRLRRARRADRLLPATVLLRAATRAAATGLVWGTSLFSLCGAADYHYF
jgi:hypothetical protein